MLLANGLSYIFWFGNRQALLFAICFITTVYRLWSDPGVPALLARVASKQQHRKVVGRTIRKLRNRAKLSMERLAERAELHPNFLGEVERGEKAASLDTLVKVAKGLKVKPHRLLAELR
jgi:DNA-binding XRE family transcriptional regulator